MLLSTSVWQTHPSSQPLTGFRSGASLPSTSATSVLCAPMMVNRSHCFPQMLRPDESLPIAPTLPFFRVAHQYSRILFLVSRFWFLVPPPDWVVNKKRATRNQKLRLLGDSSLGVPPVPIPNTEVKPHSPD